VRRAHLLAVPRDVLGETGWHLGQQLLGRRKEAREQLIAGTF
jgi:hypothetical protein